MPRRRAIGRERKVSLSCLVKYCSVGIDSDERLVICGNFNGNVKIDGFDGVQGGFGFGKRNMVGKMILEVNGALNLAVANTRFEKKERKLITSGECRTVVDYIQTRVI